MSPSGGEVIWHLDASGSVKGIRVRVAVKCARKCFDTNAQRSTLNPQQSNERSLGSARTLPGLDRYSLSVKRWELRVLRFVAAALPENDFDTNDFANLRPFPCFSV